MVPNTARRTCAKLLVNFALLRPFRRILLRLKPFEYHHKIFQRHSEAGKMTYVEYIGVLYRAPVELRTVTNKLEWKKWPPKRVFCK